MKGQGKIIKKNWIDECFSNKKRLPWRRFALDKNEWSKDESEDEIHDLDSKTSESSSSHAKDNEDGNTFYRNFFIFLTNFFYSKQMMTLKKCMI